MEKRSSFFYLLTVLLFALTSWAYGKEATINTEVSPAIISVGDISAQWQGVLEIPMWANVNASLVQNTILMVEEKTNSFRFKIDWRGKNTAGVDENALVIIKLEKESYPYSNKWNLVYEKAEEIISKAKTVDLREFFTPTMVQKEAEARYKFVVRADLPIGPSSGEKVTFINIRFSSGSTYSYLPYLLLTILHDPNGDKSYTGIVSQTQIEHTLGLKIGQDSLIADTQPELFLKATTGNLVFKPLSRNSIRIIYTPTIDLKSELNSTDSSLIGPGLGDTYVVAKNLPLKLSFSKGEKGIKLYFNIVSQEEAGLPPGKEFDIVTICSAVLRSYEDNRPIFGTWKKFEIDSEFRTELINKNMGWDNKITIDEKEKVLDLGRVYLNAKEKRGIPSKFRYKQEPQVPVTLKVSTEINPAFTRGANIITQRGKIPCEILLNHEMPGKTILEKNVLVGIDDKDCQSPPGDFFTYHVYVDRQFGSLLFITEDDKTKPADLDSLHCRSLSSNPNEYWTGKFEIKEEVVVAEVPVPKKEIPPLPEVVEIPPKEIPPKIEIPLPKKIPSIPKVPIEIPSVKEVSVPQIPVTEEIKVAKVEEEVKVVKEKPAKKKKPSKKVPEVDVEVPPVVEEVKPEIPVEIPPVKEVVVPQISVAEEIKVAKVEEEVKVVKEKPAKKKKPSKKVPEVDVEVPPVVEEVKPEIPVEIPPVKEVVVPQIPVAEEIKVTKVEEEFVPPQVIEAAPVVEIPKVVEEVPPVVIPLPIVEEVKPKVEEKVKVVKEKPAKKKKPLKKVPEVVVEIPPVVEEVKPGIPTEIPPVKEEVAVPPIPVVEEIKVARIEEKEVASQEVLPLPETVTPEVIPPEVILPQLTNSDFRDGLEYWQEVKKGGGDKKIEIINEGEKYPNVLEFIQSKVRNEKGKIGVEQRLNMDISEYVYLVVKADVKVISSSLKNDGTQGGDYPIIIELEYEDARGNITSFKHGFLYQAQINYPKVGERIARNSWYSWTSPNLIDLITPTPRVIKGVKIYGSGMEIKARVANLQLICERILPSAPEIPVIAAPEEVIPQEVIPQVPKEEPLPKVKRVKKVPEKIIAPAKVLPQAEIPVSPVIPTKVLANGDFANGLRNWEKFETGKGVSKIGVSLDSDEYPHVLEWTRVATAEGKLGVSQSLWMPVADYISLILTADVKILYSSFFGDKFVEEIYPLILELEYTDIEGNTRLWKKGFKCQGKITAPELEEMVKEKVWQPWTSGNLIRQLSPRPSVITKINIYGFGWGFWVKTANIQLIGE
ncbi:MAG: hypothetical protein QME42_07605 [bacterium]|nr:hypothetical protein [bacterium]